MGELADSLNLAGVESDTGSAGEVTDESLARAAGAGDEAAFEQLFDRHRRRISRLTGRFFNRPERIEEVVQDIFMKVYFALGNYSPERGASFAAWLSRVAINSCYDELRRARRRPESSISDVTEEEARLLNTRLKEGDRKTAESTVIMRDLANKLLARLSAEDRMVVTLLNVEDMSATDIAGLTGWSVSKVKVRAHRARVALRRVLDEFS